MPTPGLNQHLLTLIVTVSLLMPNLDAMGQSDSEVISFSRDVRPILTNHCYACHGPDAAALAAGLRLDVRESAVEYAIVPGDASSSEVMRRIGSDDDDEVMPPPELHKPLEPEQIEIVREWIDAGATYEPHWAYKPLVRPELPQVDAAPPVTHPIDRFLVDRLQQAGVEPAPPADPITLIRRLSFDLTGLPPTPAEVDQFVNNDSPRAYDELIDRLLRSPRYGERMAIYWLDLVRYADTVGYHGDQNVSVSPYRDYVIQAFNQNMPYDQFVREQLAGDLLPNPTRDQLVATGYNRLNQTTEEGGAQPKEYLAIYFADRVRNVSQVFMGATVGCAQCHDHKFDPYTARDFYSLGAFFADVQEVGKYGARQRPPEMPVPTDEQAQQLETLQQQIESARKQLETARRERLPSQPAWEVATREAIDTAAVTEIPWIDDAQDTGGASTGEWNFISRDQGPVHSGQRSRRQQSENLTQHFFLNARQPVEVTKGARFYTWVHLDPDDPPAAIMLQLNRGKRDGNWDHRAVWGSDQIPYGRRSEDWDGYRREGELPEPGTWVRLEVDAAAVGLPEGSLVNGMAFTQFGGTVVWDSAGVIQSDLPPQDVIQALRTDPDQRTSEQTKLLNERFLAESESLDPLREKVQSLQQQRQAIEQQVTTTVITQAVDPRPVRILPRGNWMDDSGELVQPAVPEFLGQLKTDSRPTRLDLANWLCRDDNVLTARTLVNRLWYLMFGRGIATSVDDLGLQGTYPSHPELLDYLAVELVESGWDIQHILRLIATSDAYQQTSRPRPGMLERDPFNNLFARQGRFRVSAEMIRDTALLTSGLLVEEVGGPSVRPYQPKGYYSELNFPRRTYSADSGSEQYRRGVYTHWQRTFLHPMLKAFDAPNREECTAQRARSNTPIQALTLLNDPTFVEAARVFAARILEQSLDDDAARIQWAFRQVVSRLPDEFESQQLAALLQQHREQFVNRPEDARKLLAIGNAPVPDSLHATELAAWTGVARVILNLREATTRY